MTTTKTGMRTVVAAAAAGALILGSASGAIAAPKNKPASEPRVQSVSIHGHSPVNVWSVDSAREIKLRATVRYAKGKTPAKGSAPDTQVWLDTFTKKVAGAPITTPSNPFIRVQPLDWSRQNKKDVRYTKTYKLTAPEVASLKAAVAEATKTRTKVYLCISNIAVADVSDMSNKVEKRLGKKGKAVRDCVKVIDVDPKSTTTTKDDGPETTS
jgi:hypothetical protein